MRIFPTGLALAVVLAMGAASPASAHMDGYEHHHPWRHHHHHHYDNRDWGRPQYRPSYGHVYQPPRPIYRNW